MRDADASRVHRLDPAAERGAAVADFAMVSGLLALVFVAVLQVGLALHVRNTLISCASEGARVGARAGASPADGVARTQDLVTRSVSGRYATGVTSSVESVDGVQVVVVRVEAPLPVIGLFGPSHRVTAVGRAFAEAQ